MGQVPEGPLTDWRLVVLVFPWVDIPNGSTPHGYADQKGGGTGRYWYGILSRMYDNLDMKPTVGLHGTIKSL